MNTPSPSAPQREDFDRFHTPNYSPADIIPVRGEGSRIWDQNGNEYLDLAGGIAVTALGHSHPVLVQVLKDQADKIWHLSNVMTNEPALRLAKRLVELTFADKVFFANSGSEANEAALKLARRFASDHYGGNKNTIISCINSFHGRTLFTVSTGGQPKYTEGFGPLPERIEHIEFNSIEALESSIDANTCAFIVEPVQGEGGVTSAHQDFLTRARELCDKHNALLIFDEVQCGMGRTGKLYAYEHYNVTPDILTTAKALGGGFPISAMLTTDKVAQSLTIGSHGSTYGGNALATAVAGAALDIISAPSVLAGVHERREKIITLLEEVNAEHHIFDEYRGMGLLIGARLSEKYAGRARDILNIALEKGLLTLVAGPDVMRLAPSLVISDEELDDAMVILQKTLIQFATE